MSEMKNSALPWIAKNGINIHDQAAIYSEETGETVSVTYQGSGDADLIVKAVNSHQALVDLANRFRNVMEEDMEHHEDVGNDDWAESCKRQIARIDSVLNSLNH